jgi:hypothetical protein
MLGFTIPVRQERPRTVTFVETASPRRPLPSPRLFAVAGYGVPSSRQRAERAPVLRRPASPTVSTGLERDERD